jgi:hypothetical protein
VTRLSVRMYRQGLGDCFLLTFFAQNGDRSHVVVDCGLIQGAQPRQGADFPTIVADIAAQTQGHPVFIVATHQHYDHMSGFLAQKAAFTALGAAGVWLSWTEDPNNAQARALASGRSAAALALGAALAQLRASGAALATELTGFTDNLGVTGIGMPQAMDVMRSFGPTTYLDPASAPFMLAGTDVRVYALGPPRDETKLHRMSASASSDEMYGVADALAQVTGGGNSPFAAALSVSEAVARADPWFASRYYNSPDRVWRSIDAAWLTDASQLAIQLDSYTNNTSLVLAFEFPNGDVALFPGDAQIGSWESWLDLSWTVGGRTVTGKDLLARTVFYKVGHHGSHNATMKAGGLETMGALKNAMIPVDKAMAVAKNWTRMPLPAIVSDLEAHVGGSLFRNDENVAAPHAGVTSTPLFHQVDI